MFYLIYNMGWNSSKRKLPQPMLYSYNLGSYWIHSLNKIKSYSSGKNIDISNVKNITA
mgnify:CR=1 FL=1